MTIAPAFLVSTVQRTCQQHLYSFRWREGIRCHRRKYESSSCNGIDSGEILSLSSYRFETCNPRSAKITCAAFLPGAIETPGPGWLPEPHKYALATGVLYSPNSGIGRS